MLMFVPADLPRMPQLDTSMLGTSIYGPYNSDGSVPWEMTKLVANFKDKQLLYDVREFIPEFRRKNLDFIEWMKHLPSLGIINAKLHKQFRSDGVSWHVDLIEPMTNIEHYYHLQRNEPCGYRIIAEGAPSNKTYIMDPHGKRAYCNMPENMETNTYIMNYTTGIHGIDEDIGRTILTLQFEIDSEKHEKIVRKSLYKYREYAVFFDIDSKYG